MKLCSWVISISKFLDFDPAVFDLHMNRHALDSRFCTTRTWLTGQQLKPDIAVGIKKTRHDTTQLISTRQTQSWKNRTSLCQNPNKQRRKWTAPDKKWKCKISLKAKDMPEYSYNDSQVKQLTSATKEVQTKKRQRTKPHYAALDKYSQAVRKVRTRYSRSRYSNRRLWSVYRGQLPILAGSPRLLGPTFSSVLVFAGSLARGRPVRAGPGVPTKREHAANLGSDC